MSNVLKLTKKKLDLAMSIVDLSEKARKGHKIDEGMIIALKIALNWRGLLQLEGTPKRGLFPESLAALIDASDEMADFYVEY